MLACIRVVRASALADNGAPHAMEYHDRVARGEGHWMEEP
jgi:hypothetical protein